jgi:putative holliday junction resolvase
MTALECLMKNYRKFKEKYKVSADNLSRILAIDYGTKRIGIAISDPLGIFATPRGIIENGPRAMDEINGLIKSENVRTVIVGIPRTLSNTESEMTTEVIRFRDKLINALSPLGVSVVSRDERLTSIMAETNIRSRELPKMKREKKSLRDEEAARILLQEYLDSSPK